MRVLVATDAWHPQVNGVVRSLEALVREAPGLGAQVEVLSPLRIMTYMAKIRYPRMMQKRPGDLSQRSYDRTMGWFAVLISYNASVI